MPFRVTNISNELLNTKNEYNKPIVIDDIIIDDIQKLQPESFFMMNKQLLYIRNKNEIVSYFV